MGRVNRKLLGARTGARLGIITSTYYVHKIMDGQVAGSGVVSLRDGVIYIANRRCRLLSLLAGFDFNGLDAVTFSIRKAFPDDNPGDTGDTINMLLTDATIGPNPAVERTIEQAGGLVSLNNFANGGLEFSQYASRQLRLVTDEAALTFNRFDKLVIDFGDVHTAAQMNNFGGMCVSYELLPLEDELVTLV